MVEILLSLLLLIEAVPFTLWPPVAAHDRTIDCLFVTLTGTMLTLLFLLNFIRQLRTHDAKELTATKNVCRKWLQAFRGAWLKGGAEMKKVPSRIGNRAAVDSDRSEQSLCQRFSRSTSSVAQTCP
jgi:hypothetical protein